MTSSTSTRRALTFFAAFIAALSTLVWTSATPVLAAPSIAVSASSSPSTLAGTGVSYQVGVANNGDQIQYNVSVTATLAADVIYDGGSTSPAEYGNPTVRVNPTTGVTTLIWSNVSDLQIGDSLSLGFTATPRTTAPPAVFVTYPVAASVPFSAAAYSNTDPRTVPRFNADGTPVVSSYTNTDSATSAPTSITAITIDKSEPSPEGELLRGVHNHTTVYTLDINVTDEDGVNGVVVTDMLPASLEFLGCGGIDNSSTPEFPGAPSLTGTSAVGVNCLTPTSVSTVNNPAPDGSTSYPAGVYTRVVWNLGNLAAGANVTIQYAAGIPLRANTMNFGGPTPTTGAPFAQTANLDNNNGVSTRETASETSITNRSRVSGTYLGVVEAPATQAVSDVSNESVSVEDVRIRKSVTPGVFNVGGIATYTVVIDTSEYVTADNLILTDSIGNGLCPLDDVDNYSNPSTADCDPTVAGPTVTDGVTTTALPYTSVVENVVSGGFDMTFTVTPAMAESSTLTVTYQARMRTDYSNGDPDGRPTVAGDSFTNNVAVTADTAPVANTAETGVQQVGDVSSAGQSTTSQSIDKRVKPRADNEACNANIGAYTDPTDPIAQGFGFRLGDEICFRLTVNFATGVFNKNPVVTDFLPPGVSYNAGSMVALPSNDVAFAFNETAAAADTANPSWEIGTLIVSDRYVSSGGTFDVVLAGTVDSVPSQLPDVTGNLMKMVVENTPGATSSFRDETPFALVPAVPLTLDKTVASVDTPLYTGTPLQASPFVQAGSVASYEIDVSHAGSAADGTNYTVRGLQVYDVLPQPLRCANFTATAHATFVDCFDSADVGHPAVAADSTRSVIVWDFTVNPLDPDAEAIAFGGVKTLTYNVTWPAGIAPERTFTNTAGVRSYEASTQAPGVGSTYYPANNINTAITAPSWNAPAASDTASVRTRDVVVTKTYTTPVLPGNAGPAAPGITGGQAVIGEVVTYNYSVMIPAGTSVYGGRLTDALPSGWSVAASPAASFTYEADTAAAGVFSPAPGGVTLTTTNGRLDLGATYTNSSTTDQRFTVTVNVVVPDEGSIATTTFSTNRNNTARFEAANVSGGPSTAISRSVTRTMAVIQPSPNLTKVHDAGGPVVGGQTLTFTVTAANPNGRPSLYDSWIVDCIPSRLTYGATTSMTTQVGAGAQVPTPFTILGPDAGPVDGCVAGTTRVGWRVDELAQNTTVRIMYTATVSLTAVGGDSYANTVALSGSSLNDGNRVTPSTPANSLERVYTRTTSTFVNVAGSTATKTADKATATIGETVTYTATASIGANTNFYQTALVDTVPAGIDRSSVALVSATCEYTVSGDPCPGISGSLWATGSGAGGTVVFFYGDILADPLARTLTAEYSAVISDVGGNTAGTPVLNSVNVRWDPANTVDPTTMPYTWARQGTAAPRTVTVVEPNLVTTKAVSDPTPALTDTFTYTVTVRNTGSNLSPAYNMVVVDTVPAGIVPGAISNGGSFDSLTREITWDAIDLPGPLSPNGVLNLTYTATFDDTVDVDNRLGFGDSPLVNTVDNDDYDSLATGGRNYTGNSDFANVDADFPTVTVSKTVLSAPPAYINGPVTWQIYGTNTGAGTAGSVDVTDVLPPNWEYVTGTSSVTVGANPSVVTDPAQSGPATARELDWAVGPLLASQTFTISFQARPTAATVVAPGVGSTVAHANTANAAVTDATGAAGNSDRTYDPAAATASTRIDVVDVQITSTTPPTAVAGTSHSWMLTVSNNGPDVAVGPFTVTNVVPAGTSYVSAIGTGWSCGHDGSATGGVVTCARTNSNDTLTASGPSSTFPPIAMTVAVDSDVPAGTVYTDAAAVSGRTFDTDLTNNTDDASTTVTNVADVAVVKSHTGSGIAGTNVNWTVSVSNAAGPSTSRANVVTVDTLPAGVSFVAFQFVDADLSCVHDGAPTAGTITCTRASDMPVGAVDTFTFTTFTDTAQLTDVVNTVVVNPTTFDPNAVNNTAADTLDVSTSADLAVNKAAVGTLEAGSSGQYQITVSNLTGPSDAGAFSFTDTLPTGVTATGVAVNTGGATCGAFPATGPVTCNYAGGIDFGQTFTLTFDVIVAPDVVGTLTNTVTLNPAVTVDPNPANNAAEAVNGVNVDADLAIVKTGPATVVAGTDIAWTLTVTNNGPSDDPATITVSDTLPNEVAFNGPVGDPSGEWLCTHDGSTSGGVLSCTNANGLTVGESQVLTVNADVLSDAGPAAASNTASVSSVTTDSDQNNNQSTAALVITDDVELTIVKTTTGTDPVLAGETTEFSIEVTNAGPSTADNVAVVDAVPAGMTIVSFDAPAGWTCTLVSESCTTPAMAPGTAATITVGVAVASNVADGATLTNTASTTTSSPGDDPDDNSATADVEVTTAADLSIVKAHDGTQVRAGDNTTFTFAVANAGPSDARADIVVADTLPAGFTYLGATGPWMCVAGDPTEPAGQLVECWYMVNDLPAPLPAGATAADLVITVASASSLLPSTVTNAATVTSTTTADSNLANNSSSVDVTVVTETDLSITKTVSATPAVIGDDVTWTVVVENNGPSDAADVIVTDDVAASVTSVVVGDATGWTCHVVDNDVSCVLDVPLAAFDSAEFTITGVVTADAYPELVNTAVVSTSTPEPDVSDNTSSAITPVAVQSDLGVTKTREGTPRVGGQVTYRLTATNYGPTENTGVIVLTDVLPAGLTFVSATGTGWVCDFVESTVTCTYAATLAVEELSVVTLVADVEPQAWPQVTNVVSVSSPHTDVNAANNVASEVTPVIPLVALAFQKFAGVVNGNVVPWQLTVTNQGPNSTVGTLEIVDTLPGTLAFESFSGAGWTCRVSGQVVSCTSGQVLAVGESSTLTISTTILATPGESVTNSATVTGGGSAATGESGASITMRNLPPQQPVDPAVPPAGPAIVDPAGVPTAVTGSEVARIVAYAMLLLAAGFMLRDMSRRPRRDDA